MADGILAAEARGRVPGQLEKVGLEGRLARLYPHELSGEMKQRTIIATAIALDPELIIADEPTTALDVNVQRTILETLGRLRREMGVAVLIVSHDIPVHAQLADRIGIMYAGQLIEVGAIRPVLKEPLQPYTQGLIGSVPAIGGGRKRLSGIAGVAAGPREWPVGCRFHPRCPHAMDRCSEIIPALATLRPGPRRVTGPAVDREVDVAPDRAVACHLYQESRTED